MLEVTDTENVTVTVVVTGSVLVEVSIILKLLVQLLDANTLYVLVVHIVVVLENVQDVTVVHLMYMDITSQVSVLSVVTEVVTLTLGLQVVILSLKDVVSTLAQWVEISEWATTLEHHTGLMVGTVTVSITTMRCLQELHSSEL